MATRWGPLRGEALRHMARTLQTEEEVAVRAEQKRLARAIRLRQVQRLMEPSGPPERQLTRAAMEQMRYLLRDSPEEWPISRLARSFDVSPDVVARVLRSRFSPSAERAQKQDSRVQLQLGGGTAAIPAPGPTGPLLLPSPAGAVEPLAPLKKRASRRTPPPARDHPQGPSEAPAVQDQKPRLQVVQKGQEFVDGDGNFLYRIPT